MSITTMTRVSTDSAGGQANGASGNPSISADGRFVAFTSDATNLVSGDTNGTSDVFVKDLQTGVTTRVSTSSTGGQADLPSLGALISGDGRLVAFESLARNLLPEDTNFLRDVFVKDLQTGVTTRVSTDSLGENSDNVSFYGPISADGRFVAFSSSATNLVPGDTNGASDVFVKDLQTGVTTRVSINSAGDQGDGWSYGSSISADGRFVAFSSRADNLVPGDSSGWSDVFVRDLQAGVVTRASTAYSNTAGVAFGDSDGPSISADGRFVAFQSRAGNLVPGDSNIRLDVFVADLQTGALTLVSTDSAGVLGNGDSSSASISADGRFIAFQSTATNLVPGDTNARSDIFVKDMQTGVTARVNIGTTGWQGNRDSQAPSISADGRFIAFSSDASTLVPGDTNGNAVDVFVTQNPFLASLTEGPDTWTGTAGNDTIDALGGADNLNGASGSDSLIGGAGNDTLVGGSGADTLYGGEGDDVYYVDATDLIGDEPAGRGLDKVNSSGSFTLGTGLNQLFLTGTTAIDGTGNDGNNLIGGNGGSNRLLGQGGADELYGQGGRDTLDGGTGNDVLIGGAGSDRLTGGAGGDRFVFTGAEVTDATADLDVITDYSRAAGDVVDLADPVHGYTVIGVVGGALQIHLVGGNDIVQFNGITNIDSILFV